VKKHSEKVAAITSAREMRKQDYDRAQLGGDGSEGEDGESKDGGSEFYGNIDGDAMSVNVEGDVGMSVERLNKRRRTEDEDMVGHIITTQTLSTAILRIKIY